jgi:membrane protease YdiL (CAAX protease family)
MELLPYLLLLLAILASGLNAIRSSLFLFVVSVIAGLALQRLAPIAILWITALGLALFLPKRLRWEPIGRGMGFVVFGGLAFAMLSQILPGFNNLPIYQNIQFSPDSIPFTMYLNFDQTVVGLFLFLSLKSEQTTKFDKKDVWTTLKVFGLLSVFIFTIVLSIRYVHYDFKFPDQGWIWILNNLFFVCLAEEGFFRGFVQKHFSEVFPQAGIYKWASVCLSAFVFGAAHYKGGAALITLATIAGLFFGYAYQKTNRIESSMLVHFGLNLVHFIFFSYPALILG